jgi:hypothetical protein
MKFPPPFFCCKRVKKRLSALPDREVKHKGILRAAGLMKCRPFQDGKPDCADTDKEGLLGREGPRLSNNRRKHPAP